MSCAAGQMLDWLPIDPQAGLALLSSRALPDGPTATALSPKNVLQKHAISRVSAARSLASRVSVRGCETETRQRSPVAGIDRN